MRAAAASLHRHPPTTTVAAAQCIAGSVLLLRPRQVAAAAAPPPNVAPAPWVTRVLGARQLAQGAVTLARPSVAVTVLGAVVEATHAASMLIVAAMSSRYRRPALISAGFAGASGAAQLVAAHAGRAS